MSTNTVRLHRVLRATGIAVFLLFCREAPAQAYSAEIPRHLAIARELVERIKPEDNRYALGKEFISVPGDGPDPEDFVFSIEQEKGFRHIRKVGDMKPGDLLAHAMQKNRGPEANGHHRPCVPGADDTRLANPWKPAMCSWRRRHALGEPVEKGHGAWQGDDQDLRR